jgi:hypothetical protein
VLRGTSTAMLQHVRFALRVRQSCQTVNVGLSASIKAAWSLLLAGESATQGKRFR